MTADGQATRFLSSSAVIDRRYTRTPCGMSRKRLQKRIVILSLSKDL
jgi:hypothetical protein